ncbi:threonine synthase [Spirochaetia bacterium]|nr:threonine synthase [Spirochaetia bacterium]
MDFAAASITGLAPDGGLYVPEELPRYSQSVLTSLAGMSYHDIAFETILPFVRDTMSARVLHDLIESAYTFAAPLVPVADRLVLELFHGPTAAFKDFGARFMARAFSYFRRGEDTVLHVLTATSGDTGGAVAAGFYGVEGIDVTILYPKGRVTPLQEHQIAGLGGNISALAVEGSFDDCQTLVKAAFADEALKKTTVLSSANSINIARLIPQIVYYTAAAGKIAAGTIDPDGKATPRIKAPTARTRNVKTPILCVPSGNFGDLTAGLYAQAMGAPIHSFIAATNINKTVPDYLVSGTYQPRASQTTISNAMDVGAPSNFERMIAHFSWEALKERIQGASISDDAAKRTIKEVHDEAGYFLDPHTAVGWAAVDQVLTNATVLATAHPAKFSETVAPLTGPIPVPESLTSALERNIQSKTIKNDLSALRSSIR